MDNKEKYITITKVLKKIESGECIFICPTVELVLNVPNAIKSIPELLDYKPDDRKPHYAWWYGDEEGKQQRIKVLKELQHKFKNN